MLRPPIVCDICGQQVQRQASLWTCENGRKTVLHSVSYDVCEGCFALHAHGIDLGGAASPLEEDDLDWSVDDSEIIIEEEEEEEEDNDDVELLDDDLER